MKKLFLVSIAVLASVVAQAAEKTLRIYFIDVEGGQSTLVVTPAGESLLIDAGFPGQGGGAAQVGDPLQARDANRIVAAARDAGIDHIDYLLITHFHSDHVGGVPELMQLMPVNTFIDHGTVSPDAEKNVPGTFKVFDAYSKASTGRKHIEPKPGDKLPLKAVDVTVVSTIARIIDKPLRGAGEKNPACAVPREAQDPYENPRSTGFRLQYGKFSFLDIGDLSGAPLDALACPNNLVGPVDVYLVAHHGGADAADPATFAAFNPRVVVMNNGMTKGGALETYKTLQKTMQADAVWQLHRSTAAKDQNFADSQIANIDESTAHWLKVVARADGSFDVFNPRTNAKKTYGTRK